MFGFRYYTDLNFRESSKDKFIMFLSNNYAGCYQNSSDAHKYAESKGAKGCDIYLIPITPIIRYESGERRL